MGKKPGSGTATNNDDKYFALKVDMRLKSCGNNCANVLECFAGEGLLWDAVEKLHSKKINRTKIDINNYQGADNIQVDSIKALRTFDIHKYDIIDLDSWGSPIDHLDVIFKRKYRGIVHCTYCNPMSFNPNKKLAEMYFNMTYDQMKIKRSLFASNLKDQILFYLRKNGIKQVFGLFKTKRNYFWFSCSQLLENEYIEP